jgi:hypothetical protein
MSENTKGKHVAVVVRVRWPQYRACVWQET